MLDTVESDTVFGDITESEQIQKHLQALIQTSSRAIDVAYSQMVQEDTDCGPRTPPLANSDYLVSKEGHDNLQHTLAMKQSAITLYHDETNQFCSAHPMWGLTHVEDVQSHFGNMLWGRLIR